MERLASTLIHASERALPAGRAAAPRGPVRVCLVAPSLDILGGQSVVAQRLLAALGAERTLEVTFVPHNPRLPGPLRLLQRVKYLRTVATSIAYVASLLRHVRRADVVHVFSASYWSFILAPLPALLVSRLYGKRSILNYRSGEAEDHLANWPRSGVPFMRLADAIVVPSDYLVGVFARFGLRASAICNFVDAAAVPHRERAALRPRFFANRNFASHYNVACVLRAFARIQRAVPDAELVVAGDGAERAALHALAESLALRNVRFLGAIPPSTMGGWYDWADVYLNAPNIDNMPNSILEAFAAGLPVVSTDAGGIPFIVGHEQTGLLVGRDDDAALAAQALRLLDDERLAGDIARRARAEFERRYSWAAVGGQWLGLYHGLAAGAAQGALVEAA